MNLIGKCAYIGNRIIDIIVILMAVICANQLMPIPAE